MEKEVQQTKALITYGTNFATVGTAEEIGKILQKEGFDVKVSNLKEEKVPDISEYDLVVVGGNYAFLHYSN